MGEIASAEIREYVPMDGLGRPMLTEPAPFGVGHRRSKGTFSLQAGMPERLLWNRQASGRLSVPLLFRQLPRERHEETETVLQIVRLGVARQPREAGRARTEGQFARR